MRGARQFAAALVAAAVLAGPSPGLPAPAAGFRSAEAGYAWEFPADHGSHAGYAVEWWYFTGQLESTDAPRRRFGFQFTLFRIGLTPEAPATDSDWNAANLLMGHASITDKDRRTHRFSEVLYRETPFLAAFSSKPGPGIAWSRGPVGTAERWTLDWNGDAFDFRMTDRRLGMAFALSTIPTKPLVLQGPGGHSRKSDDAAAASHYYSFTRLATTGSLTLDGRTFEVAGESWMDHEFSSSQLSERQVGWDWFGLQLADGRELMLYALRRADGTRDFARGTLIERDGAARYLDASDWTSRVTGTWTSAATGAGYPSGWRIELPGAGLVLDVRPEVVDQENNARLTGRLFYWEGAVTLTAPDGTPAGRGYVELTGYGEDNRPPI